MNTVRTLYEILQDLIKYIFKRDIVTSIRVHTQELYPALKVSRPLTENFTLLRTWSLTTIAIYPEAASMPHFSFCC